MTTGCYYYVLPKMMKNRGRSETSAVGLVIGMAILGALANLGVQTLRGARFRSRAAAIIGDFQIIESAAVKFRAERGRWPVQSELGSPPPDVMPFIGKEIPWSSESVAYRWENRTADSVAPVDRVAVGLHVRTGDRGLIDEIARSWDGTLWWNRNIGVTFIVLPLSGSSSDGPEIRDPAAVSRNARGGTRRNEDAR